MVLEHALLTVRTGEETEFETAFGKAKELIAAMHGFGGLTLSRCIEQPNRYLLLVRWEQLTDHTEGFRSSAQYAQWRRMLHHFYSPLPTVEHFAEVLTA